MPKPRHKTTNWRKYNNSLVNRGSLIFWIDEEAIAEWKQSKHHRRGRPRLFSDLAHGEAHLFLALKGVTRLYRRSI